MIEKKNTRVRYYRRRYLLKEFEDSGIDQTPDNLLKWLLGDAEGWTDSDYYLSKYSGGDKLTFLNRLNMCWVWPLFLLTTPFQWLFTGSVGVSRNSRVGRVVGRLVGWDK